MPDETTPAPRRDAGSEAHVLSTAFAKVPLAMVLTDPRQDDNPITYVNGAFERVTLYTRERAVGRNCRFLQGESADPADVAKLREAVTEGRDVMLDIDNEKADGTPFRNRLMISPIRDEAGTLCAFLGIQRELPTARAPNRAASLRPAEADLLERIQQRMSSTLRSS